MPGIPFRMAEMWQRMVNKLWRIKRSSIRSLDAQPNLISEPLDLPVRDIRKDEEGAADRSGKSHQTRGEQHSCTEIEVLGFPCNSNLRVVIT